MARGQALCRTLVELEHSGFQGLKRVSPQQTQEGLLNHQTVLFETLHQLAVGWGGRNKPLERDLILYYGLHVARLEGSVLIDRTDPDAEEGKKTASEIARPGITRPGYVGLCRQVYKGKLRVGTQLYPAFHQLADEAWRDIMEDVCTRLSAQSRQRGVSPQQMKRAEDMLELARHPWLQSRENWVDYMKPKTGRVGAGGDAGNVFERLGPPAKAVMPGKPTRAEVQPDRTVVWDVPTEDDGASRDDSFDWGEPTDFDRGQHSEKETRDAREESEEDDDGRDHSPCYKRAPRGEWTPHPRGEGRPPPRSEVHQPPAVGAGRGTTRSPVPHQSRQPKRTPPSGDGRRVESRHPSRGNRSESRPRSTEDRAPRPRDRSAFRERAARGRDRSRGGGNRGGHSGREEPDRRPLPPPPEPSPPVGSKRGAANQRGPDVGPKRQQRDTRGGATNKKGYRRKAGDARHPNPYVRLHPLPGYDREIPQLFRVAGYPPHRNPPDPSLNQELTYDDALKPRREPWVVIMPDGERIDLKVLRDIWWCPREYGVDHAGGRHRSLRKYMLDRAIEDARKLGKSPKAEITPPTWFDAERYVYEGLVEAGRTEATWKEYLATAAERSLSVMLQGTGPSATPSATPGNPPDPSVAAEPPEATPPAGSAPAKAKVLPKRAFYATAESARACEATGYGFTERWPEFSANWEHPARCYGALFLENWPISGTAPILVDEVRPAARMAGIPALNLARQVVQAIHFPAELARATGKQTGISVIAWPMPPALLVSLFREPAPEYGAVDIRLKDKNPFDYDGEFQANVFAFLVALQYWAIVSHGGQDSTFARSGELARAIQLFEQEMQGRGIPFWHWNDDTFQTSVLQAARGYPVPLTRKTPGAMICEESPICEGAEGGSLPTSAELPGNSPEAPTQEDIPRATVSTCPAGVEIGDAPMDTDEAALGDDIVIGEVNPEEEAMLDDTT